MKYVLIIVIAAAFAGCGSSDTAVGKGSPFNAPVRSDSAQNATPLPAFSPEPTPKFDAQGAVGKWSQGGDPIDTTKFDADIAEAERAVKGKPDNQEAKSTLAKAYFDRAYALTEVRQYAAALGDYRRALKADPNHEDSKKWIDRITGIYTSLNKQAPKEGEEPKPLPFKKA